MTQIGILHHPRIPDSAPLADTITEWLRQRDIHVWLSSTWDEQTIQRQLPHTNLMIVIGGDGSLLRAARLSVNSTTPIFGINMGRVGFLSEAQPDDWPARLNDILEGNYWVEERLMLHATLIRREQAIGQFVALNDLVIGRGQQARVVYFELEVDGDLVTQYTADALLVATPTGTTAYSMAAGGPLLPPQLQNVVVLPVAAHLSFDRALVLHEEADIAISIELDHEAYLTPDGQHGVSLESGDRILIRKHEKRSHFARVETSGYFYRRLMSRLGYRTG